MMNMVLKQTVIDTNKPKSAVPETMSILTETSSNTVSKGPSTTCPPSSQHDCYSTSCDHAANKRLLKGYPIKMNDGNDRLTTTNNKETLAICDSRAIRTSSRHIYKESVDSIDSSSTDKKMPAIPDGGYGWAIVGASLVVSLIADGLGFSFGLINSELLNYFGESASKTAWISSLFFSVPLLMGPIWSNLVDKYGCRKMTIFGGFLSAVGFGLSSLCNSVEMLMLTFGIISGLGLGIGYVTAVVSIAFWFDKKRTFATGIAASGTGIGTFLYAPLTQCLIDNYGWRIATLILSGTMLNTCICGALMRDPDWLIKEKRLENENCSQKLATSPISIGHHSENKNKFNIDTTDDIVNEIVGSKSNIIERKDVNDTHHMKRLHSEIVIPTYFEKQYLDHEYRVSCLDKDMKSTSYEDIPTINIDTRENTLKGDITETPLKVRELNRELFETSHITNNNDYPLFLKDNDKILNNCTTYILKSENNVFKDPKHYFQSTPMTLISPLNLPQIGSIPSSNLQNMQIHSNMSHDRGTMFKPHFHRTISCPNIFRNSITAAITKVKKDTWYECAIGTMKSSFKFSLFADAKFTLFNLSILFLFIWFMIPYLYLPEHMKIHGYEATDSAHMISVIGIAQTIGMIGLGYVGDRSWMNVTVCYSACMVVCGIAVLLMPLLVNTYSGLLLACIAFGFTFASSYSLTPSICVRIVDLDDFTSAYGLVLLVQGIGMIVGPPIAGAIFEITLRWDDAFYLAGAFIVISGAASYLIELFEKGEKVRSNDINI